MPRRCDSRGPTAAALSARLLRSARGARRRADLRADRRWCWRWRAQTLHCGFWIDLGRTSMFLLWIGLCGAGVLCRARTWLHTLPAQALADRRSRCCSRSSRHLGAGLLARTLLELGVLGGAACCSRRITGRSCCATLVHRASSSPRWRCAISTSAHEWRRNVELQATARVHALQARIRPHFLFNSMNTIAALTRSNPARAEEAVQDLADLFRANLNEKRNQISLRDEIDVARTYQRIEQLRLRRSAARGLEDRRAADATRWCPASRCSRCSRTPSITASSRAGGGTVTVTGEAQQGHDHDRRPQPVPRSESTAMRDGNRLALANIRERLELMYGERATVKAERFDDEYIVTLLFPCRRNRQLNSRACA